ncbi:MAG: hypothetical protein J6M05_05160 [Cardiobacteriaceae bacterium]|nr:hypothetical protein [Cardiobacteriaceae bacterium]
MQKVEKIYIDLDGVLADFDGGVLKFCGYKLPDYNLPREKVFNEKLWQDLSQVPNFYRKLELILGAKELFNFAVEKFGNKVEILSAIPRPEKNILNATEDKIAWCREYLSADIKVNLCYREEKQAFCLGKEYFLIDDLKRNIQEWENSGGTGILFINPEQTISQLKNLLI